MTAAPPRPLPRFFLRTERAPNVPPLAQFTNDPERDPELSGSTVDRTDPTQTSGMLRRLWHYAVFLSGFPFGFERLPGIVRHAIGRPLPETWIDHANKRRNVQLEYTAFVLGYTILAGLAFMRPTTVGANLFYYWILPHMLGAGHLRYYQTAEHRACRVGSFTDTNAWIVSRTTATWWIYAKLAWNMPYHSEHHAWPNVPFYLLPALHQRIKEKGSRPASGCHPGGEHGFLHMHCTYSSVPPEPSPSVLSCTVNLICTQLCWILYDGLGSQLACCTRS